MKRPHVLVAWLLVAAAGAGLSGQSAPPVPRPFPRPGQPAGTPPAPGTNQPRPAQQHPAQPAAPANRQGVPDETSLGLPVYPASQFLASYDAGHGQRFYLFGTIAGFADVVAYYRSVLKQKGDLVFDEPATHMFEVGRFREETMGFPPGITVKDYTWGGMAGYPNPRLGAEPARFPTLIQVVPAPPVTADPRR